MAILPSSNTVQQGGVVELTETTWHYTNPDQYKTTNYDITFSPQGILTTTHPNDRTPHNDFWQQKGDSVFFQYNNKYSEYKGRIIHPGLIEGTAANHIDSWTWKLERFIPDPT